MLALSPLFLRDHENMLKCLIIGAVRFSRAGFRGVCHVKMGYVVSAFRVAVSRAMVIRCSRIGMRYLSLFMHGAPWKNPAAGFGKLGQVVPGKSQGKWDCFCDSRFTIKNYDYIISQIPNSSVFKYHSTITHYAYCTAMRLFNIF